MNKFWMILRLEESDFQSASSVPCMKHRFIDSAKQEAERLTLAHPGQTFVILEAKAAACHNAVQWTAAGDNDELPF